MSENGAAHGRGRVWVRGSIVPALALLLLVGLLANGLVHFPDREGGKTFAFGVPGIPSGGSDFVDVKLDGEDHITGTIGAAAFAPGDIVGASIDISASDSGVCVVPGSCLLDSGFELKGKGVPFTEFLYFSKLHYGSDDLLADPGVNLMGSIDQNPSCGGWEDGRLSLNELQCGVNGLPAPGSAKSPTVWEMEVTFALDHVELSGINDLQGEEVALTFVFHYRQATGEPYN